jgi:hypothetical protein
MGPGLHLYLSANSSPSAMVHPMRIAWSGSPSPFHGGMHEGPNQRWEASQSNPCIERGLGGYARTMTQRIITPHDIAKSTRELALTKDMIH